MVHQGYPVVLHLALLTGMHVIYFCAEGQTDNFDSSSNLLDLTYHFKGTNYKLHRKANDRVEAFRGDQVGTLFLGNDVIPGRVATICGI